MSKKISYFFQKITCPLGQRALYLEISSLKMGKSLHACQHDDYNAIAIMLQLKERFIYKNLQKNKKTNRHAEI